MSTSLIQGTSTIGLGNFASTPSCPFPSAPAISTSSIPANSLPYAPQSDELVPMTTLFSVHPTPSPQGVSHHPTRTITLAGHFKLTFTESDVPHAPSVSFANDLDKLNHMWDDISTHWNGHSVLVIRNHPIAIVHWKQVYTSKNGKDWKPGQWKILKGRYFEWRVSAICSTASTTPSSLPFIRCWLNDIAAAPLKNSGPHSRLMGNTGTTR